MILSRYTMGRLVIPLMTGVVLGRYWPSEMMIPLAFIGTGLPCLTLAAWWFRKVFSYRTRWIPGVALTSVFIGLGWLMCSVSISPGSKSHYIHAMEGKVPQFAVVRIAQKPIDRQDKAMVFADVLGLIDNGRLIRTYGGTRITVRVEAEGFRNLKPGSYFLAPATFKEPLSAVNPWEFNYAQWLIFKGAQRVLFVYDSELHGLGQDSFAIRRWGAEQQQRMITQIRAMGLDTAATGMASAMLFGEKSTLQADDSEAFRKAGVMHVLCVSGLHAGSVYAGALFLVSLLFRARRLKKYGPLLALLPVIAFACITGLAPSVCRATLMLGLHAMGRLAHRKSEGINIMAGAALVMIWADPPVLFDLGFQFSFIAVASIILLAIPAISLTELKGKGIRSAVGGLAMVSLAAQAGTAPLSLYHFHTFPSYFLPANLMVVPTSTVVIYTGMISVGLNMIGICPLQLAWLFRKMVWVLGEMVRFWGDVPGASILDIPFQLKDSILIYIMLVILSSAMFSIRKAHLWLALPCLLLVGMLGTIGKWNRADNAGMLILSSKPAQIIAWDGTRSWYYHNDTISGPTQGMLSFMQHQGLRRSASTDLRTHKTYTNRQLKFSLSESGALIGLPDNGLIMIPREGQRIRLEESAFAKVFLILHHHRQIDHFAEQKGRELIVFPVNAYGDKHAVLEKALPGCRIYDFKKEGCFRVGSSPQKGKEKGSILRS